MTPSEPTIPAENPPSAAEAPIRLTLAPEGNEARYRVREQLVELSFPSDAVGATKDVSGGLVIQSDGTLVRDGSGFEVDLSTFKSDNSRRDRYIQNNTLQTSTYPTATFAPTEAIGLPSPLPSSGEVTFQLAGEMTAHGVTHPVTWEVGAQVVDGKELVGSATTSVTFEDFGMRAPRVSVVLSVEETIRLELDFHFLIDPPLGT